MVSNKEDLGFGASEQTVEMTGAATNVDEGDENVPKVEGDVQPCTSNLDEVTPLYPKAFYCPLSGSLLHDPVVSSDGISYERAALELRGDDMSKVYENRSLKTIIDEAVDYQTSSKLKRLGRNLLQLSQHSLNMNHRPLPEGFYCPITLGLIHVPVIDPEGYSYEKVAIENWIKCNGASPVTRRAMTMDVLYPNKTLVMLMAEEKNKCQDQIHPAFKLWSEEPLPNIPDVEVARDAVSAPAFPTTPEELEAANRRRYINRTRRWVIGAAIIAVLVVLAWMVPAFSTALLVLVLLGISAVGWCSSNNSRAFQHAGTPQGARVSALPITRLPSPPETAVQSTV
jgi:U-box domain